MTKVDQILILISHIPSLITKNDIRLYIYKIENLNLVVLYGLTPNYPNFLIESYRNLF